jgi:hypothetical protein
MFQVVLLSKDNTVAIEATGYWKVLLPENFSVSSMHPCGFLGFPDVPCGQTQL